MVVFLNINMSYSKVYTCLMYISFLLNLSRSSIILKFIPNKIVSYLIVHINMA